MLHPTTSCCSSRSATRRSTTTSVGRPAFTPHTEFGSTGSSTSPPGASGATDSRPARVSPPLKK
jgi:hypothetical protein